MDFTKTIYVAEDLDIVSYNYIGDRPNSQTDIICIKNWGHAIIVSRKYLEEKGKMSYGKAATDLIKELYRSIVFFECGRHDAAVCICGQNPFVDEFKMVSCHNEGCIINEYMNPVPVKIWNARKNETKRKNINQCTICGNYSRNLKNTGDDKNPNLVCNDCAEITTNPDGTPQCESCGGFGWVDVELNKSIPCKDCGKSGIYRGSK